MSDEKTIIQAAKDHFEAMSGRSATVWANQAKIAELPRVEFEHGPIAQSTASLKGDSNADLMFQITVVTEDGKSSGTSDGIVQSVINHFRAGTRISDATVLLRPAVGAPFLDGSEWRVPVTIRMQAILSA